MLRVHRLPFSFDPAPLAADVAGLGPEEWTPHFNRHYHDGGWSGAALRAVAGDPARLFPDPDAAAAYADTPLLARCEGVRAVLARIACPVTSVRFLRLAAGSAIREHRDYDLGYQDGELRLHVPVLTHPGVDFFLAGERIAMELGECWYLDLNLPHRVENRGAADRVHLVLDCVVDDWLAAQFPPEMQAPGRAAFAQFRALVFADPALQERLQAEPDAERFAALAARLARERGLRFAAQDVRVALRDGRRAWFERWI